jgi:pimeloyl-ACP methyl ester carboxylesterase
VRGVNDSIGVLRHFVTVSDRQAHFRRAGAGPAVVLLHDTPRSSESLLPLIEALAPASTVIALDLPGYGASEGLGIERPSIADYAAATSGTLDALGVARCVLAGMGVGGCVAAEIAVQAPDRVSSVIVADARESAAPRSEADIARACPPLVPDYDATHLIRHWFAVRDEHVFRPWWDRRAETRLRRDLPDPDGLNRILLERLRAGEAYADGLRAASGHDLGGRLARLGDKAHEIETDDALELARLVTSLAGDADAPPPAPARQGRNGRMSRAYVDTPYGQTLIRFREEAEGRPVILLHASPVSGLTLEGLVDGMAHSRPVYALDTIANGESDKPNVAQHPQFARPSMAEFADWLIAVLDGLGFDKVDLYGSHTGAMISLETAIRAPERIASLILDGVTMHDEAESEEIFAGYFADIRPRQDGGHLLTCWTQMQDVTLWHPWFVRDVAHISEFPIIRPSQIHEHVVEMLKRGEWHERCYRPVYEYPTRARLPLLTARTLIATPPDDYLERFSAEAASLSANARTGTAPRGVTDTGRYYAPFVPDSGVARYFLDFFEGR